MKQTLLAFVLSMALMLSLTGCGIVPLAESEVPDTELEDTATATVEPREAETDTEAQAASTMTAYRADGSTVILEDGGDDTWMTADGLRYYLGEDGVLRARGTDDLYTEMPSAAEPEVIRQDGERYEGVSTFQGMEETVLYEHIVNKSVGFEIDYDYETFTRHSEADRECFVLSWDDPEAPEYYLEVSYSTEDAETVAAVISEELSKDYEIIREPVTLDRAGSCIRIGASEVKGGGYTADQMQMVYIIPSDDGCRIATEHYGFESSDFFGARFRAMVNTLSVIDRGVNGDGSY